MSQMNEKDKKEYEYQIRKKWMSHMNKKDNEYEYQIKEGNG